MELLKDIRYEEYLSMHYKDDFEERQGNVSELANVLKALELEGKPFGQFIRGFHPFVRTGQDRTV